MMNWLLDAALELIGISTTLIAFAWIPASFVWATTRLERANTPSDLVPKLACTFTIGGGIILWLAWRYLLPDWWVGATYLPVSD